MAKKKARNRNICLNKCAPSNRFKVGFNRTPSRKKKQYCCLEQRLKDFVRCRAFSAAPYLKKQETEKEETSSLMMSVMLWACACDFCYLKCTHKPAQTFQCSPVRHKDPVHNCSKPGNIKNSCC